MNLVNHKQLLQKYSHDISVITGLKRGIAIIHGEIEDEWETQKESLGFFDLKEAHCEYQEKCAELQVMKDRLSSLREKLDDNVGEEYSGAWYADAELYNFFLESLGVNDPHTAMYRKRLYMYYGPPHSRASRHYDKWRRSAIMRDNRSCRICGETNRLEVHHLFSWEHHPKYRFTKENGVTLCKTCHDDFHVNYMGGYEIPCTLYDYVQWALSIL